MIKRIGVLNAVLYFILFVLSIFLIVDKNLPYADGFFYIDALSVFFIFIISLVSFSTALYSVSYVSKIVEDSLITVKKAILYYVSFNVFCLAMFLVIVVKNLGMMWVAVEMTTLVSALLVGFYNKKESIEAAWKYIIVCSVGIVFALLGTIIFSYALSMGAGIKSMNWTDMIKYADRLDKNVVRIAFIFIFVGYGTKAGIVPMHTWLPDAHSQAVSPISSLLSGVLLKTSLYALIRFGIIAGMSVGHGYVSNMFIFFGMISILVSSGFMLVQKDMKRLLAYSSIEHVGLMCVGLGIGTSFALRGAFLHMFNHAVTKSLMFFGAGNITSVYKRGGMNTIRGVIRLMPFTGIMVLFGVFALTGFPPFGIFLSKSVIIFSAFAEGRYILGAGLLFLLAIAFSAMILHFSRLIFGQAPNDVIAGRESLSTRVTFLFLFINMLFVGTMLFWLMKGNFMVITEILKGNI